jgi:hypothetical protein
MNPLTLIGLIADPEFQRGFLVGAAALVVLGVVKKPGWLLSWGVAAFLALAWTGGLGGNPETPAWGLPVAAVVAAAGTWALWSLERRAPAWAVGIVFALWVLGVWGTVPDTERARVPMGVAAALLPALWPRLGVPLGWPGALLAIAALGFVTVTDGAPRATAMIGSFGMVGMPVVVAALTLRVRRGAALPPWALIVAQGVHVIVSGRVAGQAESSAAAHAIVIASALVTGGAVVWTRRAARSAVRTPERNEPVLMPPGDGRTPPKTPLLTGFERTRKKR